MAYISSQQPYQVTLLASWPGLAVNIMNIKCLQILAEMWIWLKDSFKKFFQARSFLLAGYHKHVIKNWGHLKTWL